MAQSASLHHSFAGKRVLVTGAASGIGRAVVQAFHNDGAQVFALDHNAEGLASLKKELSNVNTVCADLLNWDATRAAVQSLAPLDHLVNNAGILITGPLHEASAEAFDKTMGVNVRGYLNVSQAFVKGIVDHKRAEGGTIVNISSIGDTLAVAGSAFYGASKGAVTMLTKSMALEYAELNPRIRVNAVCPGLVMTNILGDVTPEFMDKVQARVNTRAILKHRCVEPRDTANAVLFLSSPLAEMITGTSLVVDRGVRAT